MTHHLSLSRREFLRVSSAGLVSLACLPSVAMAGSSSAGRWVLSSRPRVAIVGVGAAGARLLGCLRLPHHPGVDSIAIDADQIVREAGAAGLRLVHGLGSAGPFCFGRRKVDTAAAAAHRDELVRALRGADLILLIGSLGGNDLTAAAPFVARLAREAGALTIAIMTTPFGFEGRRRLQEAARGQDDLAAVCATLILPSDRSSDIVGSQATLRRAVDCRDEAVCAAARAIVEAVTVQGRTCLGFADMHATFQNRGSGAVGIGAATGPQRAERAVEDALSSPFLRDFDLPAAAGVFAQVAAMAPSRGEIERVASALWRAIGDDAAMIVGDVADQDLGGTLRVTLLAASAAGRQS